VIWSRLERSHGPGRLVYQAGLEFLEHQQDAVELIEELVSVRLAFPKTSLFDSATPGQQEQLLRVERASDYFSEHPDEVAKWADYAIAAKVAPRTAPRDLVFAIWEYLDRVVDLELVKKFLFDRARQQQ
jgi:hypothetical protein